MGGKKETVQRHAEDLRDYTNTVAAVHLLKEVLTGTATITVGKAKAIVDAENLKKEPKIGNVVKAILAEAGKPGEGESKWENESGTWHLEAAITIGGAVYTVDLVQDPSQEDQQNYTVNITSKLSDQDPVARGKLFFDPSNTASVKLTYKEGELKAVTKKGLEVSATSWVPYPFQNETLAKFSESLTDPTTQQRLAILGTGSGKSIVMAGVAQAVGKTVMIVPDKTLVDQQAKEVGDMHSAAYVRGVKLERPKVFTLDTLKDSVDIDWSDPDILDDHHTIDWAKVPKVYPDEFAELQENFSAVLEETGEEKYDQIVLQAEHPLFQIIAPSITDAMVLIDESHRHTFKEEDARILESLKAHNSILALTATPTSKLYEIFPGAPLDDLSLGGAIEIGTIRPIKPEVAYAKSGDLITQAVTNYFNDYYLKPGMNGYVNPVDLKQEIMAKDNKISAKAAERMAMNQALDLNRIRCQRNMVFSDDKETRTKVAETYQKISNGDAETIEKYKENVANIRREALIEERLAMETLFSPGLNQAEARERIAAETGIPVIDLVRDIRVEQQKDIQRTINSFAIALVFGEKQATVAEKDRTHKLGAQLESFDQSVAKYNGHGGDNSTFGNPPLLAKLKEMHEMDRDKLKAKFLKANAESPIMKLPEAQKNAILAAILDRAVSMANRINKTESGTISAVIKSAPSINLDELGAIRDYSGSVDMSTPVPDINTQLAQIEIGIRTHIVADQVIATGVSIKDVLNVQIINNYSPVIESDPNVINGTLSGPQAAGRCVRHSDVSARAQQYIDEQYKGKGFILTLDEMIDPKHSASKTKTVIEKREQQAQKEEQAAKTVFISEKTKFFKDSSSEARKKLEKEKSQLGDQLDLQKALLADKQKFLQTSQAKLHHAEVALSFVPGNRGGKAPARYTVDGNRAAFISLWYSRKVLPKLIKNIQEEVKAMQKEVKTTETKIQKKGAQIEKLESSHHENAEKAWQDKKSQKGIQ